MATLDDEEAIFNGALDRERPQDRAAFLDEVCTGNTSLRRRIEQLLSAYDEGECLDSPPCILANGVSTLINEKPGVVIGAYKLLEQIGEGGMGLVFMAEQAPPLRRLVALKIIKPGLDTRAVVARFETERQALALMDYPNIARVYDAGATESGRPYFVMELVRGLPITDYCHDRSLSLRERLDLFIEVCQAVQHAHQKGIIHRDLKPTNILVSQSDTKPVPKVIDFGVAKATAPLTDNTLFTAFTQLIGTPLYMSPEQADLGNQDVDTRSDVYSLGVVLYEMLTGATPFDTERLRSVSDDEMRRIIREEEPPKPSTRATTIAAATTIASPYNSSSRQIPAMALKGDLDWIVMKALDKDRRRRYETPSELAADLGRFLESEPVLARPPSYRDKVAKWSRRHRSFVRAAAAVLAFVVVGLLIISALLANAAQLATREKEEAFKNLYRANVQIAHYEWSKGRVDRTRMLLDDVRPRPGEAELRRWEWYYTRSLCEHGKLLDGFLVESQPDWPLRLIHRVDGALNTLVDAESGDVRLTTSEKIGGTSEIRLSRDGRRLICIAGPRIRDSNELVVYDLESRQVVWRKSATPTITEIDISPDGTQIAIGTSRGGIAVRNAKDGSMLRNLQASEKFGGVNAVRWSSNGERIAACGGGGYLAVWSAATGDLIHQWKAPSKRGAWTAVDFESSGERIVTGGSNFIQMWELTNDEPVLQISAHRGQIGDVAWSPDGEWIASCGTADNFVRVWNASSGELENEFRGHTAMIESVEWLDKGRRLASKSDDNKTKIWQRDDQQRYIPVPTGGAIAWTQAGKLLVCGDGERTRGVQVFDAAVPKTPQTIVNNSSDDVICMAVDTANQRLATGCADGTLHLWDLATGESLRAIEAYSGPLRCISWIPDGSMIATSGGDPEDGFRIFNSQNGEEICHLRIANNRNTFHGSISWSPDGAFLAGFKTRDVVVWRTDKWEELHHFKSDDGGEAFMQGIAWSPTGDRFACCTGELVNVWNVKSGRPELRIRAHSRETNSISWSPDGSRFATGGEDHLIKLWDANTGDDMLTLEGHSSMVSYLSWSPDGRKLASADGTNVFIWDATQGYRSF